MATAILKALANEGKHAVGSINSIQVKTLANGARVADAAIDNFTLVELAGFNDEGERLVKQLSDDANPAYLVATPEQRFLGEDITHFYNDVDEFIRPVVLESHYTRFETSAYTLNTGVSEVENGQVAHFDVTTKKYIVSDSATPHADFAAAGTKFEVVADLSDTAGNFLVPTIRLMCTKAAY